LGGLGEEYLELRYWDGADWVLTGITLIDRNMPENLIAVTTQLTGKFALFNQDRIFLPLVVK